MLGRAFRYDVLAAASGLDEETLVEGLDELWRRQIVREQGVDAYDFSHDKLRAVAYASLGSARRRLLHKRAAEALVTLAGDDPSMDAQVAGHLEQAGDRRQAVAHYRKAAEAARAVYAAPEAIRLYRHILSNELAAVLTPDEKCDLLLALGNLFNESHRGTEAEHVFRALAAEAITSTNPLWMAKAQRGLGTALRAQSLYAAALAALEDARRAFERMGNRQELGDTLQQLGLTLFSMDAIPDAREAYQAHVHIASEIGDQRGLVLALTELGTLHWHVGDLVAARAACQQALPIAEAIGYKPGVCNALLLMGGTYEPDVAEMTRWELRAATIAQEIDDREIYLNALLNITLSLQARGQPLRALAGSLKATTMAAEVGDRHNICFGLLRAANNLRELQRPRQAEAVYRAVLPVFRQLGAFSHLCAAQIKFADLLLELDLPDEAAHALDEAYATATAGQGRLQREEFRRRHLALTGIRIRVAQGLLDGVGARQELEELLVDAGADQVSEIAYWRWRLVGGEDNRLAAAEFLQDAYTVTGYARLRKYYLELTGKHLPEAPPLPDVSALIPTPPDLDTLLAQIATMLPALTLTTNIA